MQVDRLNKWLTLLANLGVIAGIVFLAVETRQNNSLLEAQAGYNLFQNRTSDMQRIQTSPEFSALMQKLISGDELTPEEYSRSYNYHTRLMINFQWEWGEVAAGRLERAQLPTTVWRGVSRNEVRGTPTPYFRDVWGEFNQYLDPAFVRFMESEVLTEE
jgi:hypothetical protein